MEIKNRDILEVAKFASDVIPIYSNDDFKNERIGCYYPQSKLYEDFRNKSIGFYSPKEETINCDSLDPAYTIDKGIYIIYAFILI